MYFLYFKIVIINTFLIYFLPSSLDATTIKKVTHCAHFIQCQCTNHAKDIIN